MIQQLTWQTFLVATLVLTLIWYVVVLLFFFRKRISGVLRGIEAQSLNAFKASSPLPHRWEKGVDELDDQAQAEEMELMGKSKLPEGMMMVDSGGFGFAGNGEKSKEEQVGLVPDVLAEVRSLISELAKNDLGKRDFLEKMAAVRESFPKIASNPNIGRINAFIVENAPFHLSAEELENLWD